MRHHLLSLGFIACLSGCLSAPPAPEPEVPEAVYGTYIGMGPELEKQLAEEAVLRLMGSYSPIKYVLDFQQNIAAEDATGQHLMAIAQDKGYFIRRSGGPDTQPKCATRPRRANEKALKIVPLCYLVDTVADMIRLTLFAEGDAWSAFFTEQGQKLVQSGAWTQRRSE
jgi:hypothetical protein